MLIVSKLKSRRGSGMIMGLFAVMVVFAFGVAYLTSAESGLIQAKRDYLAARALDVASAGIEKAVSLLHGAAPDGSTDGSWRTDHPSSNPDVHSGDTWYTATLASGDSYKVCVRTAGGGDVTKIVITSVSTVSEAGQTASRTLKVTIRRTAENVFPWNNVIFAGTGQTGHSINGNIIMAGGVHLLGDGEPFTDIDGDGRWDDNEPYTDSNSNGQYDLGEPYTDVDHDGHRDAREPFTDVNGNGSRDPALTNTDLADEMSGTAGMQNNYNGMSATLKNLIPSIPTTSFGGETVDSLSGKVRIKHGLLGLSGTATAGNSNVVGNTTKETMDGLYITDGYGGNKGAANAYADNGSAHAYDLGDGLVKFPALTDPKPGYANYQDYLQQNSFVQSGALTVGATDFTIGDAKGSITYNATTKELTISGMVYVEGDIKFNTAITYVGRGTMISTGDINIEGDFLPKTSFPATDCMGLIAAHNMNIGTAAQLKCAGAFYAQYKIYIPKQTELAGTCVSSYFSCMNVPHLFQTPSLKDNLPPGMPGADAIWIVTISTLSWQDFAGSAGHQ